MAKRIICPQCNYIGPVGTKKRGSGKMELIGWTLLFPLGIFYTLWRAFGKTPICKGCGHDTLVDADTPVGRRMEENIYGLRHEAAIPQEKTLARAASEVRREKGELRPEHNPDQF